MPPPDPDSSAAPADAAKPDSAAVEDMQRQVAATGSVSAAADRLAEIAQTGAVPAVVARRQQWAWEDDPEEAEFQNQYEDEYYDDEEEEEGDARAPITHLQEVVDGLWIGDLVSAMDAEGLRKRGITNVVSLLRPRINFPSEVAVYTLEIDDAEETDILTHLPGTTAWIKEALRLRAGDEQEEEGGEGNGDDAAAPNTAATDDIPADAPAPNPGAVLVHCQAGMSRSATVVSAFLMRELDFDPVEAVSFLRERRSVVDPSETFWHQLSLYYAAGGRVNLKDRSTRRWYLDRTADSVMNQGAVASTEHMARYPASAPSTPAGAPPSRKIRCKMCRRHLATREHMMDHILDQAPASRPRTPSNFALPAPLAPLTSNEDSALVTEDTPARPRATSVSDVINPLTGLPGRSRRGSAAGGAFEGLAMSRQDSGAPNTPGPHSSASGGRQILDADALAARLPPQLAALRAASGYPSSENSSPAPSRRPSSGGGSMIANPKCSGYFVEPLTWMEPMLGDQVAGKLFCPNEKCKAKIGNYDWAGVQCGCREWVTPGFCLARNRVEEVGF